MEEAYEGSSPGTLGLEGLKGWAFNLFELS